MAQFHETRMGVRFYEADVPRIANALESIAASLAKMSAGAGAGEAAKAEQKCGENVCCDDPDPDFPLFNFPAVWVDAP